MTTELDRLKRENDRLKEIVRDLHWMSRRYATGRQSYAPGLHNQRTREAIALGVDLNYTGDGTIWAKDRDGPAYAGLTQAEADLGEHTDIPDRHGVARSLAITALRDIAAGRQLVIDGNVPVKAEAYAAHILRQMEGA